MNRFVVVCLLSLAVVAKAFMPASKLAAPRVAPLYENFGLDIGTSLLHDYLSHARRHRHGPSIFSPSPPPRHAAENPEENTPREIFGEVAYKTFVAETVPDGLLVRGDNYNIIERVRELKLLTLTAESGLLEALEAKGLTLSQVEKLLPVADNLGLLNLAVKNKNLLLSAAPLLIEPAPALIPVVTSLLKTPPSLFSGLGVALVGAGGYEFVESNGLLGVLLVLLGAPAVVLGSVLNNGISIPSSTAFAGASSGSASAETFNPPQNLFGSRPAASTRASGSNRQNGQRKTVRINKR